MGCWTNWNSCYLSIVSVFAPRPRRCLCFLLQALHGKTLSDTAIKVSLTPRPVPFDLEPISSYSSAGWHNKICSLCGCRHQYSGAFLFYIYGNPLGLLNFFLSSGSYRFTQAVGNLVSVVSCFCSFQDIETGVKKALAQRADPWY